MTTLQDKTPEELTHDLLRLRGFDPIPGSTDWLTPVGVRIGAHQLPPYATSYDATMPCVKALTDKQTFAFIEHLRVIRNIQATGDFAFTWLMMTSSEADLTRALILVLQSK